MSTPSHITRAQVARALDLEYYNVAPLFRIAVARGIIKPKMHLGLLMVPSADLPALRKLAKEVLRGPRS